jgi:hypothetical protein
MYFITADMSWTSKFIILNFVLEFYSNFCISNWGSKKTLKKKDNKNELKILFYSKSMMFE